MMNGRWKFASGLGALGVVCGLAVVALPHKAGANVTFQQQTGLSCVSCHLPAQEQLGEKGLNGAGHAFKNCGYKLGCNATATPAPKTTETSGGVATFHNQCAAGQVRWVVVRAGLDQAERGIFLILEPGQHLKVGVTKGSTWTAKCNEVPSPNQPFTYLQLEQVF
jgi:hypothetical protein